MKLLSTIALILALTTSAWATATPTLKQIDKLQDSTGGSAVSVPHAGNDILSDTNSISVTNKTMSGSSNTFSNIPVSAISTGTGLSVQSGGTGDVTLTTNGMLFGNGTSAVGITAAGSQYQVFQAGASGVPEIGALQLGQSAAVSGQLGAANGGTGQSSLTAHYTLVGNGTGAVSLVSPGSTAGYVLMSNGASADPSYQALPSSAPTINGTASVPGSVTAVGGVVLSTPTNDNIAYVKGGTPSSTVTVTATPSITACTSDGQKLTLISESSTALFTLQNNADLAGSNLLMNGPWTSGMNSASPYTISFRCDSAFNWVETARNN